MIPDEKNGQAFTGLTALVTGASSGIGAATAVLLAKHGAHVIVHYHSKPAEAQQVLDEIQKHGGAGELAQGDLSTAAGAREFAKFAGGRPVDILVNNAGSLIARTKVADFTEELWERVLMLNLTSAFWVTRAVLKGMAERKRGCVVNVSSIAARTGGSIGALAYAAAKAGIATMTKSLAKEFAPQGIRVNCVSPGTVDTNYHRNFSTTQMLDGVRAATPAGRLGTSEEIADTIVYLCTPGATFVHGQTLEINGGFFMG